MGYRLAIALLVLAFLTASVGAFGLGEGKEVKPKTIGAEWSFKAGLNGDVVFVGDRVVWVEPKNVTVLSVEGSVVLSEGFEDGVRGLVECDKGDRLVIAALVDGQRALYVYDLDSGSLLATVNVGYRDPIYYSTSKGWVLCKGLEMVTVDGQLVWEASVAEPGVAVVYHVSEVHDLVAFLTGDLQVGLVRFSTGELLWNASIEGSRVSLGWVRITPDGGHVVAWLIGVPPGGSRWSLMIRSFRASDGLLEWSRDYEGVALADVALSPMGIIAVGVPGGLDALSFNGEVLWSRRVALPAYVSNAVMHVESSSDGHVAFSVGDLVLLVNSSGSLEWSYEFSEGLEVVDLDVSDDGRYVAVALAPIISAEESTLCLLDSEAEALRASTSLEHPELTVLRDGLYYYKTEAWSLDLAVAVGNGYLVLGDRGAAYVYDSELRPLWGFEELTVKYAYPSYGGGLLLASDERAVLVTPEGYLKWSRYLGGYVKAVGMPPVVAYVREVGEGRLAVDLVDEEGWHHTLCYVAEDSLEAVAASMDGGRVAVASCLGNWCAVYDAHTLQLLCNVTLPYRPMLVALSPDGSRLLVALESVRFSPRIIEAYDAYTGSRLWSTTLDEGAVRMIPLTTGELLAVTVGPLYVVDEAGGVRVLVERCDGLCASTPDGSVIVSLYTPERTGPSYLAAYSRDGRLVGYVPELKDPSAFFGALTVSDDGGLIALWSGDYVYVVTPEALVTATPTAMPTATSPTPTTPTSLTAPTSPTPTTLTSPTSPTPSTPSPTPSPAPAGVPWTLVAGVVALVVVVAVALVLVFRRR